MPTPHLTTHSKHPIIAAGLRSPLALLGRLLIAFLFIPSGVAKFSAFNGLVAYIASKGLPLPELCAGIAIAAELGLGLLVLLGWQTRWAALGLAIFVAVITPIFHNYWAVIEAQQQLMQKQAFSKNLAIVGGLLFLACLGGGQWSLETRGSRKPRPVRKQYTAKPQKAEASRQKSEVWD